MPRYRKKPVEIDAVQMTADLIEDELRHAPTWVREAHEGERVVPGFGGPSAHFFSVETDEGDMRGDAGDWLIRGVEGELYPCRDSVFRATYDAA